ncbi:class I SAM-dependent methyltransferase [Tropicimonas marinistellae]|uniref:class I SAM-dependent methyltransferase n=1 Tax=Tropicimonas marinistellae TaxID=1739787 RepID=UPI000830A7B3|nr:class I SAM-dependent methyltransferase [Tropicimonas marinistellae]
MDKRAAREREFYNEGLNRAAYDRSLNPAKVWFLEDRRNMARNVFVSRPNARVLEIGSATWFGWIETNGVHIHDLTCINISETELESGKHRAEGARNQPDFLLMDAQDLAFPDGSFDIVFGAAILHHLDFERSVREIRRVLKPNGIMFFVEPLAINPVGKVVRFLTPRARTPDERPLGIREFRILNRHFDCHYTYEGLMSVPAGVLSAVVGADPKNALTRSAYVLDKALRRIPGLGYLFRHVFIVGTPKPG